MRRQVKKPITLYLLIHHFLVKVKEHENVINIEKRIIFSIFSIHIISKQLYIAIHAMKMTLLYFMRKFGAVCPGE